MKITLYLFHYFRHFHEIVSPLFETEAQPLFDGGGGGVHVVWKPSSRPFGDLFHAHLNRQWEHRRSVALLGSVPNLLKPLLLHLNTEIP